MIMFLTAAIIVVVILVWLLRPIHSGEIRAPQNDIPQLKGLPPCSVNILNGAALEIKIMKCARRCYSDGKNSADLANKIQKMLKGDKLKWPSYDIWKEFIASNRDRFHGTSIQMYFPDEISLQCLVHADVPLPPPEVEAYAATFMGLICIDKQIARMVDAGFKTVTWKCNTGMCCSLCESLNDVVIPIDKFLDTCLVHPGSLSYPVVSIDKNM